jgi:hypothetical protein
MRNLAIRDRPIASRQTVFELVGEAAEGQEAVSQRRAPKVTVTRSDEREWFVVPKHLLPVA